MTLHLVGKTTHSPGVKPSGNVRDTRGWFTPKFLVGGAPRPCRVPDVTLSRVGPVVESLGVRVCAPDEVIEGLGHSSPLNYTAQAKRSLVESRGRLAPSQPVKGSVDHWSTGPGSIDPDRQPGWLKGGKFIFPPSTAVEGSTSSPPRPRPPPPSVASTRRRGISAAAGRSPPLGRPPWRKVAGNSGIRVKIRESEYNLQ
ncbi:hypothetical protein Sjap_010304 [Stephania japonica]|uniref:Uncharacterized protein n=1 Tax=Stephania japonica TaxID=461633 RepID=A0AAP0P3I3_9MAGN